MSPSGQCLVNAVDWYKFAGVLDSEGSISPSSYPASPTVAGIDCSCQLIEADQEIRDNHRITTYFYGWVEFDVFYPMTIRDKLVWADGAIQHNLFVIGITDGAGRGGVFGAQVEERT